MPWFLGNRIEIYSNHHWRHLSKKTPNCEDHCRLKRRSAALRFELWVSERPWWPVQVPCNFSLVSWHVGVPPPEKLTAILHLKMSQNPKGTSIRNHPFSGAFAVVYEFDACRPQMLRMYGLPIWKVKNGHMNQGEMAWYAGDNGGGGGYNSTTTQVWSPGWDSPDLGVLSKPAVSDIWS